MLGLEKKRLSTLVHYILSASSFRHHLHLPLNISFKKRRSVDCLMKPRTLWSGDARSEWHSSKLLFQPPWHNCLKSFSPPTMKNVQPVYWKCHKEEEKKKKTFTTSHDKRHSHSSNQPKTFQWRILDATRSKLQVRWQCFQLHGGGQSQRVARHSVLIDGANWQVLFADSCFAST